MFQVDWKVPQKFKSENSTGHSSLEEVKIKPSLVGVYRIKQEQTHGEEPIQGAVSCEAREPRERGCVDLRAREGCREKCDTTRFHAGRGGGSLCGEQS